MKNQMFFDGMRQYKVSNQPYAVEQEVFVCEDKFTLTHRFSGLPSWLKVSTVPRFPERA